MAGFRCRHDVGRSIEVRYDDAELFEYVYRPEGDPVLESPRPYLHPVRTRAGALVTIHRPHDHVWHKGISWALPHFGPDNFWGGPTYVHGKDYQQLPNNGSMDHVGLTALDVADERVTIGHDLHWHTETGEQVVTEARTLVAEVVADAWALVFETSMTNVSGRLVPIGSPTTAGRDNAGYGGLFWRGPRSFTGGRVLAPQGGGGDELRGQRAAWMGFCGRHDGTGDASSIVLVDPDATPQWFVRSEDWAGVCPAPFFSTETPFEPDAVLRFRYAVVVADGESDGVTLAEDGRKLLEALA